LNVHNDILIRETSVEVVRPLRHAVLRAGLPPEAAVFDGDNEASSHHIGAFLATSKLVGCASIVRRPWNGVPAWQLRGMAVDDALRGRGVGKLLLAKIEQMVLAEDHSTLLWCNARTPAVGFYSAMGWQKIGEEFVIATAGPHYRMFKPLR